MDYMQLGDPIFGAFSREGSQMSVVSLLDTHSHCFLSSPTQYLCDGGEAVLKRLYNKMLKDPTTVAEYTQAGMRPILLITGFMMWFRVPNSLIRVFFSLSY